jgi:hypothetical protein
MNKNNNEYESNRDMLNRLGVEASFKHLTHLGKLRAKISAGELAEANVPYLLSLGQNGGAKTRKERRYHLLPKQFRLQSNILNIAPQVI